MDALLSILIPTTPYRMVSHLSTLVRTIMDQIGDDERVEIICLLDNERISIGEKMNRMIAMSSGRFISAMGDDDMPSADYVSSLLEAIESHPDVDVIVFDTAYYVDGLFMATINESKDNKWNGSQILEGRLDRTPSEKMAFARRVRIGCPMIDEWDRADIKYTEAITPFLSTEHRIDKTLYHYYYKSTNPKGKEYRKMLDEKWGKSEAAIQIA
jgi:glycosyltransferase involved in cell wall biosynthesis